LRQQSTLQSCTTVNYYSNNFTISSFDTANSIRQDNQKIKLSDNFTAFHTCDS